MSLISRTGMLLWFVGVAGFASPQVRGIGNFDQVDQHVFRGAQPTADGIEYLAKNGVKTVIDLREKCKRSLEEEREVTAAGMHYVNVPMTGLTPPTAAETSKLIQLLEDETTGPVFVHCKRGADRTGAVIAAYRIDHDHWENQRALTEAMSHGMAFFQLPRQAYIRGFRPITALAKAAEAPKAAAAVQLPLAPLAAIAVPVQ